MDEVRLGIIGAGGMAQSHLGYLKDLAGVRVTAVSDTDPDTLKKVTEKYDVRGFDDSMELLDSGEVDAVLIATPHYFHPVYSQAAFERGIHALSEKPVAVTAKAAEETNAAYAAARKKFPNLVYAAMFNQRTRNDWKMVKRLLDEGRVGELIRISWTITNWFRTQAYYDSGGWRATWEGEGGGVLINQCPHNLDLFQWFVGMPRKVQALVGLGKHHDIEVEDDVIAMMEFENGATGTFVTSTGEAPGINRLEIAGENGTVIAGDDGIRFIENARGVREFCRNSPERFATPDKHVYTIQPGGRNEDHKAVTRNFVNVILGKEPALVASGTEGIHALELGNAILMSGLQGGKPVAIPTPRDEFDAMLKDLIKNSRFKKKEVRKPVAAGDLATSF